MRGGLESAIRSCGGQPMRPICPIYFRHLSQKRTELVCRLSEALDLHFARYNFCRVHSSLQNHSRDGCRDFGTRVGSRESTPRMTASTHESTHSDNHRLRASGFATRSTAVPQLLGDYRDRSAVVCLLVVSGDFLGGATAVGLSNCGNRN
jgi:hypothetical protein